MKLEAVTVQLYRNFVDAQRIVVEPDVTCLVGKNESGKTTDELPEVSGQPYRCVVLHRLCSG